MAAMTRALAALLLLAAPAALAHTITFIPPNPTTHTSVDALVRGSTPGCPARPLGVTSAGATITLRITFDPPPNTGCIAAFTPYSATYHLGLLPAGVYDVVLRLESENPPQQVEVARRTLIVRDVDALRIRPYAVPVTGGKVVIENPPANVTSVTVGGVVVQGAYENGELAFVAPPHAAGAASVSIGGAATTLVYYAVDSTDPAVVEPLLFPLSYDGPGAFGSQWTTENYLTEGNSTKRIINNGQPWGQVLYVPRGTLDRAFYTSRTRDLSRQAQSAGVEIPVVRERDFRIGPIELLNVPHDARFRAMIRIWTMEDLGDIAVGIGDAARVIRTTPIPGTALAFASLDITDMLRGLPAQPVRIFGASGSAPQPYIWAMVSITNNETQEVTIVSLR